MIARFLLIFIVSISAKTFAASLEEFRLPDLSKEIQYFFSLPHGQKLSEPLTDEEDGR